MSTKTFIQEDINTGFGTEGTLLIPRKIHNVLMPEYEKMLLPRDIFAIDVGPADVPGSSYDINLETVNSMAVNETAEGAELQLQNPAYSGLNVKPIKYSIRINITSEMTEDSQFPLLQRSIELAGKRFAENENSLVLTLLAAASNTIAGGATATVANFARMIQYLEDNDANPTHFFVGMEVANDIRNIDSFMEADKSGGVNAVTSNFIGSIYGIPVYRVSSNAGMTTTSAYLIDRAHALVRVEKRVVTTKMYDLPTHDTQGVALTQRVAFATLRSTAIAELTTS